MRELLEAAPETAPEGTADFRDLVLRHQAMVFSIAYAFLRNRATAEEVAQDVFLELHRNLDKLDSPQHVVHWLRRVAAHRSIDRQRRSRPLWALEEVREPAAPCSSSDPMLAETLRQLIATLPEQPRMVMILRYQEDMDATEIAAALGVPVNTVKSHIQRSLKLLREKMTRKYGEVSL